MLYGTPSATSQLRWVRWRFKLGSPLALVCTLNMKRQWHGGSLLVCALPGAHALTTSLRLIGFRFISSSTHAIWSANAAWPSASWMGKWRQKFPYALGTLPLSSAHGSQNLHLCFWRRPMCVSPERNQRFSTTMFFQLI